jgi:murein DD-endopeptidase MepM/ murein hydrolase activator NlpD
MRNISERNSSLVFCLKPQEISMNLLTIVTPALCVAPLILLLAAGCGTAPSESGTPVPTPPIVSDAVHAAVAGDWTTLRAKMTPDMESLVTPGAASQVTASLERLGALRSISTSLVSSGFGTKSYAFVAHFDGGDVNGTLDVDESGKIAGLLFKPATPGQASTANDRYVAKGDVHLPFAGEWYSFWGGIDPATNVPHAQAGGSERYAYDLVIMENGSTHAGAGDKNSDYYCYGRPILSPVAGKVAMVVDGIPENHPGEMNAMFLPGNCVEIDDGLGEYFALAHLQPYRMAVKVGDEVRVGQVIGYCGNSGNASEPHLNLQMQDAPDMSTAAGLPVAAGVALGKVSLANQGT